MRPRTSYPMKTVKLPKGKPAAKKKRVKGKS